MPAAVPLRQDYSARELRQLAKQTTHAKQARRLLALAAICDGMSRTEAARVGGMDVQSLRDWVIRFNDAGPDGLIDDKSPGRPPYLEQEQLGEVDALVRAGPDFARDGVVRWRCVDLKDRITKDYGVTYHERSVGKILKRLGFSHISPRPHHPKKDSQAQEAFKKNSPKRSRRSR